MAASCYVLCEYWYQEKSLLAFIQKKRSQETETFCRAVH